MKNRHINRLEFPEKHVIICEDDLRNQIAIAQYFLKLYNPEGKVTFSFVAGAVACAAIICNHKPNLILLDHDMPIGNGSDLYEWLDQNNIKDIPIITFSGIRQNNEHMLNLGNCFKIKTYYHMKHEVIEGLAENLIREILG